VSPLRTPAGARSALASRAEALRDQVRKEVVVHRRHDLVALLDALPGITADRPIRVIVAGSLKRGKSTLVNTLVGRPLLSPVGIDVTTVCWLEIGYGEDQATALIANIQSPGQPTRRPINITEVERYAALDCLAEPVVGVEILVRSALLTELTLVDTPGVGGLGTGHAQTTLRALKQADALLFVSDCTQPILAPEVDFLTAAAQRSAMVIVVMTKSDMPGCEVVVRETCEQLARRRELAEIPVFAVSPPLADQAYEVGNDTLAEQMAELSGITPLVAALRRMAARTDALRIANCAQVTASVAQALARRLDEQVTHPLGDHGRTARLEAEDARLAAGLADPSRLSVLIVEHLVPLRNEPREEFAASAASLRLRYQSEAQRGPSTQLATLAARMTADLTAAAASALELATTRTEQMVRAILGRAGAAEMAEALLPALTELIAGPATAVSVLTGPGEVAASLAQAACAGWWRARSGSEQDRRAQLRSWVNSAADQASTMFGDELARRVDAVRRHMDSALPGLLEAQHAQLARVRRELRAFREADPEGRLACSELMTARDLLQALADDAANVARAASATT
jgi:signal recognition particle receptor subunit beta